MYVNFLMKDLFLITHFKGICSSFVYEFIGGIPSSGKTTHALELVKRLQDEGLKVCIVNEESLNINKNTEYKGIR